jgi:hypothetical protein
MSDNLRRYRVAHWCFDNTHMQALTGADNPASRCQSPRFRLWTRGRVVPYKYRKALLSEPIIYSSEG